MFRIVIYDGEQDKIVYFNRFRTYEGGGRCRVVVSEDIPYRRYPSFVDAKEDMDVIQNLYKTPLICEIEECV